MDIPTLETVPATADDVKSLARLKIEQDRLVRYSSAGKVFVERWIKSHLTCSMMPLTYAQEIIPFLLWNHDNSSRKTLAHVPTEIAIGACIKGCPEHIKDEKVDERIEAYQTNTAVGAPAAGFYLSELGLYIAHEGKHRVAFMCHHNEPYFLSSVSELNYPAADRIKIVKTEKELSGFSLAVLDGRYLQLLSEPPYCPVSLLTGYGVEEISWRELNAPTEGFVYEEIQRSGLLTARPKNISEVARSFDLQKLKEAEDKQNVIVIKSFEDKLGAWIINLLSK